MTESDGSLVSKCMDVLCDQVGIVETERFIFLIRNESFDYTKWQQEHYDPIPPEGIDIAVKKHSETHPFKGKKARLI